MEGDAYKVVLSGLDELSPRDLYAMLKLRVDVFVVEQKCPYPELDGKDADALHLRLLRARELVASARSANQRKTIRQRGSAGSSSHPNTAARSLATD